MSAVSRWHHERESRCGGVPERPKGADCKSAGSRLRRFESFPLHHPHPLSVRSWPGRSGRGISNFVTPCAGIAQRLEHRPSKPRVAGSNPVSRSILRMVNSAALTAGTIRPVAPSSGDRPGSSVPRRRRVTNGASLYFSVVSGLTDGASVFRFPDSHNTPDDFHRRKSPQGGVSFPHTSGLYLQGLPIQRPAHLAFASLCIRAVLSAGMVAVVRPLKIGRAHV